MKKRHLSIWLSRGSFGFKVFITQTTVWLSEWQQTVQPCQLTSHVEQASSIGISSFLHCKAGILPIVESSPKWAETRDWVFQRAHNPNHQILRSRFVHLDNVLVFMLLSNETPFQPTRKQHNQSISAWLSRFMQIRCCGLYWCVTASRL